MFLSHVELFASLASSAPNTPRHTSSTSDGLVKWVSNGEDKEEYGLGEFVVSMADGITNELPSAAKSSKSKHR